MRKTLSLVVAMAIVAMLFVALPLGVAEEKPQYEVTYVSVWAGSTSNVPSDQENNEVAKYIRDKFGITVTMEGITTSETEYLNMMFAAGTTPDIVNAPFWGTTGGEGNVIAKAASEGQIKKLTDILQDYPDILDNYESYIGKGMLEYGLKDSRFGGDIYVIPRDIEVVEKDELNLYVDAVFARKDILDAVGVKAEDVNSMDDLYELLKTIKEANLTDWNGGNIIPMGTNHNGWRQENIYNWLQGDDTSSYRLQEDGTVIHWVFDTVVEERVTYMRKLVSEGLIDVECFTQNNSLAQEKFAQGKVAVAPIDANLAGNLYNNYSNPDHLEAEWVLLDMRSASGNPTVDVYSAGIWTGGGCYFFSPNIDDGKLRAILDMVVTIQNDQDAYLATRWGVEDVDYTMEAGYPVRTQQYTDSTAADTKYPYDRGINVYCWKMLDMNKQWWKIPRESKPLNEQIRDNIRDEVRWARDEHTYDTISVNYLATEYEGYELYTDMSSSLDISATLQSAYFVDTEEEAMQIIQDCRDFLKSAGVDDMCAFIAEKYAEDPDRFNF